MDDIVIFACDTSESFPLEIGSDSSTFRTLDCLYQNPNDATDTLMQVSPTRIVISGPIYNSVCIPPPSSLPIGILVVAVVGISHLLLQSRDRLDNPGRGSQGYRVLRNASRHDRSRADC